MKTKAFNVALPNDLVQKMDAVAKEEYRNRSELIREAVRVYLERKEAWNRTFKMGERAVRRAGVKGEENADKIVYDFRHGKRRAKN